MTLSSPAARDAASPLVRYGVFALLALIMATTRVNHFAAVPDASWGVFFAAGFYLNKEVRWAFPALFVEGVLIDYLVISGSGLSFWQHYCVSPAYWFLTIAYFAMWLGGAWLARRYRGLGARELGLAIMAGFVAINLCYLTSNGSFYWLSNSVPLPRSFSAWMKNLGDWYLPYLTTQGIYIGIGIALHAIATQFVQLQPERTALPR
ncbi:MAG: hypothetical protein QM741_12035 [Rudaea sp.]|uniref:hypothetical protein n=1 Tax=Rudaea sp. TaxID=2136325 RepID=UPI0039E6DD3E